MESLTRLCAAFGGISVVRGELFASQGVVAVPRERIETRITFVPSVLPSLRSGVLTHDTYNTTWRLENLHMNAFRG